MSKISYITNILRESISFDDAIKNGDYANLKDFGTKISDDIKSLKFFDSANNIENELSKLSMDLNIINGQIITELGATQKVNENKNTLIFFYKENCKISSNFAPEWAKLKSLNNGSANMVAINCSNPKYNDICSLFEITQYPAIKYVNKSSISQYNGKLSADNIYATFLK